MDVLHGRSVSCSARTSVQHGCPAAACTTQTCQVTASAPNEQPASCTPSRAFPCLPRPAERYGTCTRIHMEGGGHVPAVLRGGERAEHQVLQVAADLQRMKLWRGRRGWPHVGGRPVRWPLQRGAQVPFLLETPSPINVELRRRRDFASFRASERAAANSWSAC